MEVVSAAGNASADKLAVVLEVHQEDRLAAVDCAHLAHALDHVLALFRRRKQIRRSAVSDRHVVEIERIADALFNQHIQERIARDRLDIRAGVADRGAEDQAVLLHQIHRMQNGVIVSVSAPSVVGLLRSLNGERERNIAHADALLAECLVDQRRVGVDIECTVVVLLTQADDVVLADKRLAAGQHVEIDAELLALRDQIIHLLKRQIEAATVFRRPASGAVQVARRGRVEQNQPRNVAFIDLTVVADGLGAVQERLKSQIERGHLEDMRVDLVDDPVDVLCPFVLRIGQIVLRRRKLLLAEHISGKFSGQIENAADSLFRIFFDTLQREINRRSKCRTGGSMCHSHDCFPLFIINTVFSNGYPH